ncbi:MAG TPA: hypothetical protein PKY30_16695 [Myxococcota bacterium]|nr:hypothetical protein [Myxococcota bacterium]HND34133.1 hypothetical protein [Myxococcota bacterium]HNH48682.1 hypothetical protein [Myxococcota bacterium]
MSEPAALPDLPRLVRLIKLTLAFNVFLLISNAGTLYALLVFVINEPADVAGVDPFDQATPDDPEAKEKADPREEMKEFFDRCTDLLDRAARKHGGNPSDVIPSREMMEKAIETRTIHSDESQEVMQKLREGFDYYNLDWPAVIPER